jgi:phospholipid transport system substrate-binding protein
MNLRHLFPLVAAVALSHTAAMAAPTSQAEATLHAAIDSVVPVAERATTTVGLADKLRPILVKYISFDAMTRRAIGPGWRQFTPAQQSDATRLFTTLVIRNYADKYTPGQHATTIYKAATTPAPGRVEIPTTMLYKGNRYSVIYRLEEAEGWKVTDIVAEGVSLVANYRAQFDSEFKKGGAAGVLSTLQRSVGASK